jgi:outer membrane protein OmpU
MRKILLATASASVLCTFALQAQAQVVVTLGGYTEFFAGIFNDDLGPNRNKREFQLETEIVVKADGKADNGLLYGAKVELQNSTPNVGNGVGTDEASIYVGGQWGRFELGDFDGAADTLKIYAPLVGIEQIDGDYGDFLGVDSAVSPVSTLTFGSQPAFGIHIPNSGDATKVMYLTPRFAGFQAGISYTPESDSQAQNVVAFENTSTYEDWIEGGVNYTGEFSGFSVALGATVSSASGRDLGTRLEDFTAWNVGAQVGFGGFLLGGGYVDADDFNVPTGATGVDQSVWHAGLTYTAGPVAVGASYMDAEGYKGAGGTYASDYKAYGLGAAYTIAPGLVVQSDLMWIDEEVRATPNAGPTFSNEGYVFILGTRLDF